MLPCKLHRFNRRYGDDRSTYCNRDDDDDDAASLPRLSSSPFQAAKSRSPEKTIVDHAKKEKKRNGKKNYRERNRTRKEEAKAIIVTAARLLRMFSPKGNDDKETVHPDCCEEIAQGVADVVMTVTTALGLAFLMSGVLRWFFDLYDVPLAERFVTDYPRLVIGIPCLLLAMTLCITKGSDAPRTGVNGACEDGGTAEVLDDFVEASHDPILSVCSDGAGEHGMVQLPIQTPPVVTIRISSSSRSGGSVTAGSGVVTAADVELGGAGHHRRGEKERGVDMSREAVRDIEEGKNA